MGLKPYWGMARSKPWRPMLPANGNGGVPTATGGACVGVWPNAADSGFCSGVAVVQVDGTDSGPTRPACPMLADTELPSAPMLASGPFSASAAGPTAAAAACGAPCPLMAMKSTALPRNLAGTKKPDAKMEFKKWSFKKLPKAEPLASEITFSSPASPPVDEPDVGEKMSRPRSSRRAPRPDPVQVGEASPCSAPGTAASSADSVLCPVPAGVAAAWATAPDWAVSPLGLALCCGSVNDVSSVATAEEPA